MKINRFLCGVLAAAVFWLIAVVLMTVGSFLDSGAYRGWSLLCGLWAGTWTVWVLLVRERVRVETLADILLDDEPDGIRSVR